MLETLLGFYFSQQEVGRALTVLAVMLVLGATLGLLTEAIFHLLGIRPGRYRY